MGKEEEKVIERQMNEGKLEGEGNLYLTLTVQCTASNFVIDLYCRILYPSSIFNQLIATEGWIGI